MAAHEKPGALTREGNTITRTFIVYDVLDYAQAEAQAYAAADLTRRNLSTSHPEVTTTIRKTRIRRSAPWKWMPAAGRGM
jgi:hypothetical protein